MVSLRPMTEDEFQAFLRFDIQDYAAAKVRAGTWTAEEALRRSQETHDRLLPQGMASPHQRFYTIVFEGESAGRVWLSTDPKMAGGAGFILDLFVDERFRRRGIARRAMLLLEKEAIALGLRSLALHVFADNGAAQALYEQLGYSITDINMAKAIAPP